jgi:catechol 2,3-dioxygenase-like lactoylglutathione lyase family enzyme
VIQTYGLTHIALAVRDADKALRFYQAVFGVREIYREAGMIQVQTPGSHDVIVFEERRAGFGEMAGISHFGFRLVDRRDIDAAAESIKRAGGKILDQGEFVPGEPYIFAADPDGYTVEIWYEGEPQGTEPEPRRRAGRIATLLTRKASEESKAGRIQ